MPIKYCTHLISRKEIKSNLDKLYVFGDNMLRQGYGGQAKEFRGEPNSIGIPTKYFPAMTEKAFFTDKSFDELAVRQAIDYGFSIIKTYLEANKIVIIPKAGIGTGLAELPKRAPIIYKYIIDTLNTLGEKYGCYEA